MKNQFVTLEIAKQLKDKGFNEKCIAYYTADKNELQLVQGYNNLMFADYVHLSNTVKSVPAPLWQQVIEWFDLRGIAIMHYFNTNAMEWQYIIVEKQTKSMSDNYYSSNEAILEALKLI